MIKKVLLVGLLSAVSFQVGAAKDELTDEEKRNGFTIDFDECIDIAKGKSNKACRFDRIRSRSDVEGNLIYDAFEKKNGETYTSDNFKTIPSKDTFCLISAGIIACDYWHGYNQIAKLISKHKKHKKGK